MSAHTPGPWRLGYTALPDGRPCPFITSDDGLRTLASVIPHEGYEANAILFAAAPELLAALRAAVLAGEWVDQPPAWVEQARAAIAKAEGKS